MPVTTISSMGLAAAVTVFFAIFLALTLTPSLLLTFPRFFSADRWFGISCEGCCVRLPPLASREIMSSTLNTSLTTDMRGDTASINSPVRPSPMRASPPAAQEERDVHFLAAGAINGSDSASHLADAFGDDSMSKPRGCWARVGGCSQRFAIPVLLLACASMVPFAYVLPSFDYVEGVLPMLPRNGDSTLAFLSLQASRY